MGLRFRKSVKICKGVKVNFSKSGASLSLGGRGHSVTLGRRSRATIGIPGTGLSYSTSLKGPSIPHKKKTTHSSSSGRKTGHSANKHRYVSYTAVMRDDGKVDLLDQRGVPIVDPSVVRHIKSTSNYKACVQRMEIERQQRLTSIYNDAKAENDRFIEIYKLSPQVDTHDKYMQVMNAIQPDVYRRQEYAVPCPTADSVRKLLSEEAKANISGNIFTVGKQRKEYVESKRS